MCEFWNSMINRTETDDDQTLTKTHKSSQSGGKKRLSPFLLSLFLKYLIYKIQSAYKDMAIMI